MTDTKKLRELYDKKYKERFSDYKETLSLYHEGYAECLDVECGELLDEIESLEKDRKRFEDKYVRAAHSISNLEIELDRYKKALDKCKEQRDKRKSQLAIISGRTLKPSQVDHSLFVYTDDEELEQILKGSEDD